MRQPRAANCSDTNCQVVQCIGCRLLHVVRMERCWLPSEK